MLQNMPNARELLSSPSFRHMMTNPDSIRMAARLRRAMGGAGGSAFPAPGVTDNTPGAAGATPAAGDSAQNPFALFGAPPANLDWANMPNPFALFGAPPPGAGAAAGTGAAATTAPPAAGQTVTPAQDRAGATGAAAGPQGQAAQDNPFAALFNAGPGLTAGTNPFGFGGLDPELLRQMQALLGGAAAPAPPADNRPPEERYADQLRQLNDMGFFDFDRNVAALRRSGGSVQGAIEHLLGGS